MKRLSLLGLVLVLACADNTTNPLVGPASAAKGAAGGYEIVATPNGVTLSVSDTLGTSIQFAVYKNGAPATLRRFQNLFTTLQRTDSVSILYSHPASYGWMQPTTCAEYGTPATTCTLTLKGLSVAAYPNNGGYVRAYFADGNSILAELWVPIAIVP